MGGAKPMNFASKGFEKIADLFVTPRDDSLTHVVGAGHNEINDSDVCKYDDVTSLMKGVLRNVQRPSKIVFRSSTAQLSEVEFSAKSLWACNIAELRLERTNKAANSALITDSRVAISQSSYSSTTYLDCQIGKLVPTNRVHTLEIIGGTIGILDLTHLANKDACKVILRGCEVLQLVCSKDIEVRDIIFQGVTFPRKTTEVPPVEGKKSYKGELPRIDRASFGFLVEWAREMGNSEVAHIARGQELGIERLQARGVYKFCLSLWWVFSNYGLTPSLPFLWLFGAAILNAVIVYLSGSQIGLTEAQLVGWRQNISGDCMRQEIVRSIISSFEGLTAPLSGFSGRRLVVPASGFAAGFQILYGFFSIAMISLFFFSVRRRFKI